MIVALILLVPACLFAEFGFGLWNLRNWARIATIVLPCWARSAPRWDFDARLCTSGLGSASQFNSTQHRCGCAVVSRPAQRKEILRARLGRLACRLPKKCRRDRREILRSLRRKCCAQRILEGRVQIMMPPAISIALMAMTASVSAKHGSITQDELVPNSRKCSMRILLSGRWMKRCIPAGSELMTCAWTNTNCVP